MLSHTQVSPPHFFVSCCFCFFLPVSLPTCLSIVAFLQTHTTQRVSRVVFLPQASTQQVEQEQDQDQAPPSPTLALTQTWPADCLSPCLVVVGALEVLVLERGAQEDVEVEVVPSSSCQPAQGAPLCHHLQEDQGVLVVVACPSTFSQAAAAAPANKVVVAAHQATTAGAGRQHLGAAVRVMRTRIWRARLELTHLLALGWVAVEEWVACGPAAAAAGVAVPAAAPSLVAMGAAAASSSSTSSSRSLHLRPLLCR